MQAAFNRIMWKKNQHVEFENYYSNLIDNFLHCFRDESWTFDDNVTTQLFSEHKAEYVDSAFLLAGGIKSALRLYLDGKPGPAYQCFANILNEDQISSLLVKLTIFLEHANPNPPFFRIRRKQSNGVDMICSRKDIFHTPFSKRHLVKTSRYSIPGCPCLYLGRSVYVCWEEMQRPSFAEIYLSRFEFLESTRLGVLRFNEWTPDMLYSEAVMFSTFPSLPVPYGSIDHDPSENLRNSQLGYSYKEVIAKFLLSYLAIWPLSLACSIPRQHEDAPFHAEYIIPQLLTQWISESKRYFGVSFRTTRVPSKRQANYWPLLLNYAFPAKSNSDNDFCHELQKKFLLTKPISWELLQNSEEFLSRDTSLTEEGLLNQRIGSETCYNEKGSKMLRDFRRMRLYQFKLNEENEPMQYSSSGFGKAEILLAGHHFAPVYKEDDYD